MAKMDTDSYKTYIKAEYIYTDIVKKSMKNKKLLALMKDELGLQKNCYLTNDIDKNKKAKHMKKCIINKKN